MPLLSWLYIIYIFRCSSLCSVVTDSEDNVIAYDLYMFERSEFQLGFIHELYIGVAKPFQHRGIGVKLRQYSSSVYDGGCLKGISTLAPHHNISALRSAQKAGFGIIKESVKPRAYYLLKSLRCRE